MCVLACQQLCVVCRIEYALDAIMSSVHETSEITGNGHYLVTHAEHAQKLRDLPPCANDNDGVFVLKHICNAGLMPDGPYDRYCPEPPFERMTEKLSSAFVDDNLRAYM